MSEKLRMGVIGLGFIGGMHTRVIAEDPHAELVAVADLDKGLADNFAEKYGCVAYADYQEMLIRDDIDAVSICVPEPYHVAPAVAAAAAKKDILIEKPLARTLKEIGEIMDAVNENGVRLMVGHVLKFDPRYVQLKDAINNGDLGEISSLTLKHCNSVATVQRLQGKISIFYYLGVHDLEWIIDYCKPAKPTKVYCQAVSKINLYANDVDAVFMIVNFDSGALANIELNWAHPDNPASGFGLYAEITGSKGRGRITIDEQGLEIITADCVSYPDSLLWPVFNGKLQGDLKKEINHFIQAVINKEPFIINVDDATLAVALIEAAMTSIKTGEPVILPQ